MKEYYTPQEASNNREAPNKMEKGSKRYKEKIHRDSKFADKWKNLPFTFSKPAKRTQARRDIFHLCDTCQHVMLVSKFTAGMICKGCKSYSSITEANTFESEEELNEFIDN